MDAKTLINKYKNVVLNLIVLLIAVRFAVVFYKKQAAATAMLTEKKTIETKNNQVLANIAQLQETLKVYKSFANNKDISLSIPALTDIAATSSVKIISIKPLPEQGYPLYTKYPFDLKVEANNYHVLGRFISTLESHANIYNVESARIMPEARQQRESGGITLAVDLRISTILLKN
ncbi:MAG: type 4a pilus biogenesis protein PilO [Candidatus Omnitrophota bacterium]|jgi:hypothetical protein